MTRQDEPRLDHPSGRPVIRRLCAVLGLVALAVAVLAMVVVAALADAPRMHG